MPSRKPKRRKDSKRCILGCGRVNFLLFGHNPTHPLLEIADVLRDFTQLYLHLNLFLRPAVYSYSVLVQLPLESYVGTDNRTFFAYEVDRGRTCHTPLGDEICADDCSASTDTHDTMNLRRGVSSHHIQWGTGSTYQDSAFRVVLQSVSNKRGGLVEVGCDLLPEVIRQPHMHFLDILHLVGEGWVEIQDGDDVCDTVGRYHGRVLGGVEIAEVEPGDYEIRMTDWIV